MPEQQSLRKFMLSYWRDLHDARLPWVQIWQYIADYVVPRRFNIDNTQEQGTRAGLKLYDGTPISALQLLADGLYGYMVSPSIRWFRLKISDLMMGDVPEVRLWLDECEEGLYSAFKRSNYYDIMSEYFLDGGSIGTSTVYMEEDIPEQRLVFNCRHPGEIAIAEDRYGRVDTVFREFKLTVRQAVDQFGAKNLSQHVQEMYQRERYEEDVGFIHGVFPRRDRNVLKRTAEEMPWASVYIETTGTSRGGSALSQADSQDLVARVSGYPYMPYAVWRWRKNSNERYGRSPAFDALVDILGVNRISKTLLRAAQVAVEPPIWAPSENMGQLRLGPRGINYYGDPERIAKPMEFGQYPIGEDQENQRRQAIEKHFKVDFFLLLQRLERQATATEIIERQGEKAAVLGATVGRLASECLDPIIDNAFFVELTAGRLPQPPQVLVDYIAATGRGRIDIDYLGPLAQAQKRLFKSQGILQGMEMLLPMAQLKPEVLDNFDFDFIARELSDAVGMPEKSKLPMKLVQAVREQRAQQQQAIMEQEQMVRGAEGIETMAKADQASGGRISGAFEQQGGRG